MNRVLNELDSFKLLLNENIDVVDTQVIFMLYQPLIGTNAVALYLTLLQEKQLTNRVNLDFNHERLMLLLNIDQFDLLTAFKKLEAHNLIVSYYYSSKATYIYDLKRPLSAELFFADDKLKTTLSQKIGTLQFERQKYYFLKSEPTITADFVNISNTNHHTEDTKVPAFSSLQTMLSNLNKTDTPFKTFKNNLTNNVSNFNSIKNNNYQARANLQAESSSPIAHNTSSFNNVINQMQMLKPDEYILSLTKKPIDIKLKTTQQLLATDYHLCDGVINCIFEYVWFKNNKRLEPNYILKIAKTFQDNNINDINSALKHLKLAYSKSKKNSFTNTNYQQNVLWTNNDSSFAALEQVSAQKVTTISGKNGTMSQEEINKILEEFDNY